MDVAILAGGYGTRLRSVWDGPKCLAPYHGRPVIEIIVDKALALRPRKVFLLLGHKASQLVQWREHCCRHKDVVPIIETEIQGTAAALRKVAPLLEPPVLVLNGDTVPLFSLAEFVSDYDYNCNPIAAWTNRYAGACVLDVEELAYIVQNKEITALDYFVNSSVIRQVQVTGFIDIGTPEQFLKHKEKR